MAFKYFLYTTLYDNTVIDRSDDSFALPPDTGQIYVEDTIPETQPVYLWKVSGGGILVVNDDATIQAYLNATNLSEDYDKVYQIEYTGYTTANDNRVTNVENSVDVVSAVTSGNTIDITNNSAAININAGNITGNTDDITINYNLITGNTDAITTNKSDIVYMSGITDTKLDKLSFTGYTANTATKRILVVNNTIQDLNTLLGARILWDIELRKDSDYFTHNANSQTITILKTGPYDVALSVPMDYAGGGNQVNNVGLLVVINGTADVDTYISATVNKDRQQTAALAGVQHNFTAGDEVEVEGYTLGGATRAETVAGSVWFQITKVNA